MLNRVSEQDGFSALLFDSAHRHGLPVMISEKQRKSLCEIEDVFRRALSLVVNVNMRLAGIA